MSSLFRSRGLDAVPKTFFAQSWSSDRFVFDLLLARYLFSDRHQYTSQFAEMDWKAQNPSFQVLYSVIPRDDHPPSLQIRSFTSDSYEAIKKRERKKSGRREQNNTEQQSSAWKKEDTGASANAMAMREMKGVTRMASGPYNVIPATHPGTEQLVNQDGGRAPGGDELQGRLCLPGAAPISRPEDPSCGEIQCLTTPASPKMSPMACDSIPEVYAGAEREWEICRTGVPNPHLTSPGDVHMVTVDREDTSKFDQQPCIWTWKAAVERPSCPTPTDSSSGVHPDPCEQLIENGCPRSPGPISHESSRAPVVAAATGHESLSSTHVANGALSEVVPVGPNPVVGTLRSPTRGGRSERACQRDCKPMPPNAWTIQQDEQLLHLRNTAQLNWRNTVSYFPGATLEAVKNRYTHLTGSRVKCHSMGEGRKPRLHSRRITHLASSSPQIAAKQCRALWRSNLNKQAINIPSEHHLAPRRQQVAKPAKHTKHIASLAPANHEVECLRTSRSGRPIRHPFRHRPNEGYV